MAMGEKGFAKLLLDANEFFFIYLAASFKTWKDGSTNASLKHESVRLLVVVCLTQNLVLWIEIDSGKDL